MTSLEASTIRVQDLDHCGIVAGIIDEMGLVEQINQQLGRHPQEIVSAGVGVKAMILNGLGLVSAPLYLFERFFVGKATEHLLGFGIKPEHLNDDRLGRILDRLYEAGLTQLYVTIALSAASKYGVNRQSLHLDSSSMSVQGEYIGKKGSKGENNPGISITKGYSRERRPDLKQFMVDLICSGDGDVPLYLRVADGNESDRAIFAQLIRDFKDRWDGEALFVADAALYSAENLQSLQSLKWLSRVPATLSQAQHLKQECSDAAFFSSSLKGYRLACMCSRYGEIPQRWLLVESEARRESDLAQLEQRIKKASQEATLELKR